MMGRCSSEAGVDKDPVIWHALWNPSLGPILRYRNIAYLKYGKEFVVYIWGEFCPKQ